METPLTILYTHNLRGDLDALPRLYSFLRQLKAYYASEEVVALCALDPAQSPGRTLLLDLGDNCTPDVWHCQVSDGRSTLVVLDGMGFEAARVEDAAGKAAKMGGGVRLALIDTDTPREIEDVLLTVAPHSDDSHTLQIMLTPDSSTHLDNNTLYLAPLSGSHQVGAAQLTRLLGGWTLTAHEIHELPRRTLPDPTITAAVEFVVSEAKYAQKRRAT